MIQIRKRSATYTELLRHAQAEGLGWFSSRFCALLGVLGGAQVVTISKD